jgi:hypothetical protein
MIGVRHWADIGWTVVYTPTEEYSEVVADFAAYRVEATELDGAPLYWLAGAHSNLERTPDVNLAQPDWRWSIKWDGCSNFSLSDSMHCCGSDDVTGFHEAMRRTWAWAKELGMDRG